MNEENLMLEGLIEDDQPSEECDFTFSPAAGQRRGMRLCQDLLSTFDKYYGEDS